MDEERWVSQRLGRFVFDLPASLTTEARGFEVRACRLTELCWEGADRQAERESHWKAKLAALGRLRPPRGQTAVVIDEVPLAIGHWARLVRFYGFNYSDDYLKQAALVDAGDLGLWLEVHGKTAAANEQLGRLQAVAAAYSAPPPAQSDAAFHLEAGAVDLPYLDQESLYARFTGHPLLSQLEIKMASAKKVERTSRVYRMLGALEAKYARGLDNESARSGRRRVAGIDGDETIQRLDGKKKSLAMVWACTGEPDSGAVPVITVSLSTPHAYEAERTALWDRVLESVRPLQPKGSP